MSRKSANSILNSKVSLKSGKDNEEDIAVYKKALKIFKSKC